MSTITTNQASSRMNIHAQPDLPEVTEAHRRAAFIAMRWPCLTYEQALASDTHRRVIEARAHKIRTDEWAATQRRSVVPVRRCLPGVDGHPMKWCTQRAAGPLVPINQPDLL